VPLLLDMVTRRIVCNESSLIIRDFNSAFDALARFPSFNLRPPHLADAIDTLNDSMYVLTFVMPASLYAGICRDSQASMRFFFAPQVQLH
jgi:glutathionyl-hydroquinone reductase